VYDSIRKFLQFQLTVNIVAVLVAFLGAVTTGESPLKAVQLLWVNLIMDTMAALALATEPPTPELMDRLPYGRYSSLITYEMWRMIIGQAIFQMGILLFTLYGAQVLPFLEIEGNPVLQDQEEDLHRTTIVFNTFVLSQLFNEINCRKLGNELNVFKGLHKNYIFLIIMFISFAVQFVMVQYAGDFAKTVGLNGYQWLFCIFIGILAIPLAIIIRLIPVPKERMSTKPMKVPDSPRVNRTAVENWKLAREGVLGKKTGIVSRIRRTHNRGHTTFGTSANTKNYTFMEY